ncbi:GGDEF domain-containing protein [Lacibacterium aquatile]|uniref:diguanylate cyclase n=1 Tax=Lacibacterium aquatile TaxID=1168082 RepID=A0ABW5DUY9_9PROT
MADFRRQQAWVPYAAVFLLIEALVWGIVGLAWRYDRNDALDDARATTANLALAVERHVDSVFAQADQSLVQLRDLAAMQSGDALSNAYTQLSKTQPGLFLQLTVADASGRLSYSSLRETVPVSIAGTSAFDSHLKGDDVPYISRPQIEAGTGRLLIQMSRRLTDREGAFAGVASLSLNPGFFERFFSQLDLGHGGAVSIIGNDGFLRVRVIADRPTPAAAYQQQLLEQLYTGELPPFGTYRIDSPIDGEPRVGSWRRLHNFPMTVLVFLAEAEIQAQRLSNRLVLFYGGLALTGFIALCIFLIHRRAADQGLQVAAALRQEERWRFALDAVGDGVWDWNPQTREIFLSAGWKALLGYREQDVSNRPEEWEGRIHPEDRAKALADMADHLQGRTPVFRNEHRILCSDGSYRWILSRGIVVERDRQGQPVRVIGTGTDVTLAKSLETALLQRTVELEKAIRSLKENEAELRWLAEVDPLTGVANRRAFLARAEYDLARVRRYEGSLTVAMIDLDHFKSVNDTYGHDAGDMVLRAVADLCRTRLRSTDLFGRLGGEEFAALLIETNEDEARQVLEDLRKAIAGVVVTLSTGVTISVTASIGSVTMPPAEATVDELLKLADNALYQAKRSGRNRVVAAHPDRPAFEADHSAA